MKWITHCLIERKQCVALNRCKSNWTPVRSGVPQGTVLGPIVFIIHINELPSVVNSQCLIFADDTKLYQPIHSDIDVLQLQKDLDLLCE